MRVATWNVNGLRARLDFVLHWLEARQPDVVGLQELKLTDDQFPHAELEKAGYSAAVHGQKGWNGVAILARAEHVGGRLEPLARGLPGQEAMGARLVTAEIADLEFTTLYVPNGKHLEHEDFPRKLEWLDALREHLQATGAAERKSVVCGDFNIVPAALDSWDEARLAGGIFHTPAERSRFDALLELGFHDAYRSLHPEGDAFSWWDYRGGAFHKKQGLRIDFLLASASAMERTRSAETDRDYRKKKEGLTASDHAPVMAEIEL